MREIIQRSFTAAGRTLKAFLADEANFATIEGITTRIAASLEQGGKVIIFGNGGSMCDAMHFAEELTGRFHHDRPALPAIAISDPSHITCVANDYGFDQIFSRGVRAYAKPGDVVIGISTSGNSPNVIKGLEAARGADCQTVSLLGKDGGQLKGKCELELIVPAQTTDRIQEIHTLVLHIIIECVEHILFGDLGSGSA